MKLSMVAWALLGLSSGAAAHAAWPAANEESNRTVPSLGLIISGNSQRRIEVGVADNVFLRGSHHVIRRNRICERQCRYIRKECRQSCRVRRKATRSQKKKCIATCNQDHRLCKRGCREGKGISVNASNPRTPLHEVAALAVRTDSYIDLVNLQLVDDDGSTHQTSLKLRPTIQSFTDDCTFTDLDEQNLPCGDGGIVLVSSQSRHQFAVIGTKDNEAHGVIESSGSNTNGIGGEIYTFTQFGDGPITVKESKNDTHPGFECLMDDKPYGPIPFPDDRRRTQSQNHRHSELARSLENEDIRVRVAGGERKLNLWYTDNYPDRYSFQVELVIFIDPIFFTRTGGSVEAAMQYINMMVAAANGKNYFLFNLFLRAVINMNHFSYAIGWPSSLFA